MNLAPDRKGPNISVAPPGHGHGSAPTCWGFGGWPLLLRDQKNSHCEGGRVSGWEREEVIGAGRGRRGVIVFSTIGVPMMEHGVD